MTQITKQPTWLSKLNWKNAVKYACAANVRKAFNAQIWKNGAFEWQEYIDKTSNPQIGDVIVIDRFNLNLYKKTPSHIVDGWNYGHVAVIYDIDLSKKDGKTLFISDGPNSFNYWINPNYIKGYITPSKMISLGAKNITLDDLGINTQEESKDTSMGYYEEIFKKEFPTGSSVYKNLDDAKTRIGDIAYFIAIGLERSKK